ncbi:type II secretion system protein [Candidatus Uhrbacteria bacterium]|nr:type II secretion system protein [Candidatus Uhrbacteria bacterium]
MYAYNNHKLANKTGYTLIELVVAIAILTLTLFGVAELFSRSLAATHRAENLTKAVSLAQAQIETALATEYEILTVGGFEARHNVFEVFDRETSVDFIDPSNFTPQPTDTGLKRVTVNVFYPSPLGEKTLTLSTLKADQ